MEIAAATWLVSFSLQTIGQLEQLLCGANLMFSRRCMQKWRLHADWEGFIGVVVFPGSVFSHG